MNEPVSHATLGELEQWNVRQLARDYWRVPAVALLAALIAFTGSFAVSPTYAAGTTVLIRARETSILSANGTSLDQQSGVVDSQLSTSLSDTQIALLGNRDLAARVVDTLQMDQPRPADPGAVAAARRLVKATYKRLRAYVTYGFYREADNRNSAIAGVQAGLSGEQVRTGFGLNVIATGDSPRLAADVANAAADALVSMSEDRFHAEATTQQQFLKKRVLEAESEEKEARQTLATYKQARGIVTTPDEDAKLDQQSQNQIASDIRTTQAAFDGARAEYASLRQQLERTSASSTNDQKIVTGRSETQISSNEVNPAYASLLNQTQAARAEAAGLDARLKALRSALNSARTSPTGVSAQEATLSRLQLDVSIASSTRAQLADQLGQASINAARPSVELTRIDSAAPPTYPVAPKRYLFLAVGLLLGSLAAFVWSFVRVDRGRRRSSPVSTPDASATTSTLDLTERGEASPNGEVPRRVVPAQS